MSDLLPGLEAMNHLVARSAVRGLAEDSDFAALLERENAREKGPRPSVVTEIEARLGPTEATEAEAPEVATVPDGASSPPAVPPLPAAQWTEKPWRGFTLYRCRHCSHATFEVGVAYAHAQTHPRTKKE